MLGADLEQVIDAEVRDGVVPVGRRVHQEALGGQRIAIGRGFDHAHLRIRGQVQLVRAGDVVGRIVAVGRDHVGDLRIRQRRLEAQLRLVGERRDGVEIAADPAGTVAIGMGRQGGGVVPFVLLRSAQRQAGRNHGVETEGLDQRAFTLVTAADADAGRIDRVVLWIIGDDVDHARHGVEAEQRRVRALHDFDLADFRQLHGNGRPGGVAVVVEIDLAAVDQHQQARRHGLVVTADADVGAFAGPVQHVQARHAAQQGRQVVGAGTLDVVGGNDRHVDRHFGRALRRSGGRGGDGFAEQGLKRTVIDGLGVGGSAH